MNAVKAGERIPTAVLNDGVADWIRVEQRQAEAERTAPATDPA